MWTTWQKLVFIDLSVQFVLGSLLGLLVWFLTQTIFGLFYSKVLHLPSIISPTTLVGKCTCLLSCSAGIFASLFSHYFWDFYVLGYIASMIR